MGRLSKPYRCKMRIYADPAAPLVDVTWYKCAPGAKRFPYHYAFAPMLWETTFREQPFEGPGEADLVHVKADPIIDKPDGQGPIETPLEWFLHGAPTSYVPRTCCGKAIGRGIGELVGPSVWGWLVEPHNQQNTGVRERGGPGVDVPGWQASIGELCGPDLYTAAGIGELCGPGWDVGFGGGLADGEGAEGTFTLPAVGGGLADGEADEGLLFTPAVGGGLADGEATEAP